MAVEGVEPGGEGDSEPRHLSDQLGTTNVAINHYWIAPGDGLPGGLHAHADQEEAFLVLDGEVTFETLEGDVVVGAGEVVRFGRGEFQSGRNDAADDLALVAVGAPRDSDDIRIPFGCSDCGHDDVRLDFDGEATTFVCSDCGKDRVAEPCPNCGTDDLETTIGDGNEPVVVCSRCGSVFESPPTQGEW